MSSKAQPVHSQLLTFGVEFEFMAARQQGSCDPHPQDGRWTIPSGTLANSDEDTVALEAQDFVVSLLKSNGIPALSDIRLKSLRFDESSNTEYVQREAREQGVRVVSDRIAAHSFWVVSDDQGIKTIAEEDLDGYDYADMEVASRILQETEFGEVKKVYGLIQSGMRTQANSSCGLHVHVGIGHLSVESTKKLVTLMMALEEKGLFEAICAPHRSSSHWCRPVSQYSRAVMYRDQPPRDLQNHSLEGHLPQPDGITSALYMGLTRIWNCSSIDDIAKETKTFAGWDYGNPESTFTRRGGFALRNSTKAPDIRGVLARADLTIEFRYKESTGSASQDYHWLQLCLELVRRAEWPQEQFRAVMGQLSTANTLQAQLVGLGVEGNEVQWWSDVNKHHLDHPFPPKRTRFLEPKNC